MIDAMLKYRSLISQLCAIFPYVCLLFIYGSFMGFHITLIGELHKNDSEIVTTLEELSWFASLDILHSVGAIIIGTLMHRLESRLITLLVALSLFSSYLLFYYSSSMTLIFASRVLNSLLSVTALCGPYICEVSEPHLRGRFLAIAQLALTVGVFFSLLLGSLLHWRTIALVNLVFPILTSVIVLATPNSPTWLASKGRLDEAKKALCWLRGWVKPEQVQAEFSALAESVETSAAERKLDVEPVGCRRRSRRLIRLFLQRSFCLPLGTMCLAILQHALCGVDVIESYLIVVLRELDSPIEESTATAIVEAMAVVGTLVILLAVSRVGRRKLVLVSVLVVGACHATVASVGLLEIRGSWVSTIALIVAFLANFSGIGGIVLMMTGEIFPPAVRYIGASICGSVRNILLALTNKVFLYFVEAVTLPGVFLFFASMNLVALVTYYFLMPETEGKSLEEIEDHFKAGEDAKESKK